jgi:Glutamate-cysteine ligase family 2(GCS2)
MGIAIDPDAFDQPGYARFEQRLQQCLSALSQLLERPGFGTGPATVGAELELFLVDRAARPVPLNSAVSAAAADPRVNVELDRFNLELNASPTPLAGHPFAALGGELSLLLQRVGEVASRYGAQLVLIGILPTLRRADLHPGVMTDMARYRALSSGLRQLRHGCFQIRIAGLDPLELASDDVGC